MGLHLSFKRLRHKSAGVNHQGAAESVPSSARQLLNDLSPTVGCPNRFRALVCGPAGQGGGIGGALNSDTCWRKGLEVHASAATVDPPLK